MAEAKTVLLVDEARLHATRGMDWWLAFRVNQPGRCRCVGVSMGGCRYEVAASSRRHALELLEAFVGQGIPQGALSVRRVK